MTNDERLLLEKGRVPMLVVQEALSTYRSTSDRTMHDDLLVLSEKAEVPYDTLETWILKPEHSASVDFDTADRVLCACHVWNWWYSRFAEYYDNVNLKLRQCAHKDCSVWFEIPDSPQGGRKHFCSTECANSSKRGNKRIKHFKGKAMKTDHSAKCRNGHARTPENTIRLKSGKIRCRVCNNAVSNAGYHRKRELAEA